MDPQTDLTVNTWPYSLPLNKLETWTDLVGRTDFVPTKRRDREGVGVEISHSRLKGSSSDFQLISSVTASEAPFGTSGRQNGGGAVSFLFLTQPHSCTMKSNLLFTF